MSEVEDNGTILTPNFDMHYLRLGNIHNQLSASYEILRELELNCL